MTNDHCAIGDASVPTSGRAIESQRSTRTSDNPMPYADDRTAQLSYPSRHASSVAEWDSWKSVRDLA